ncbi:MAG: helix-hairpin-helix domain-containing protein [Bacteroidia bacterium]|nr:helix-hairpin-helix domain-containing protein [Bacteroidia bacterium]
MLSMWLSLLKSQAQNDSINIKSNEQVDELINQNVELLSEQLQTEDGDLSNLTETWTYYKSHPINLNKANREELADLLILNDIQINNLLKHREKNGYLINIYELQSIDGFDLNTIKKILPFVYVNDNFNSAFFSTKEMFKDGKHELVFRFQRVLEKQAGYNVTDSIKKIKPNSYYLGDPNRIFARYRFQYNNNVSVAISGEKDAGEELFKGTQKQGFDFYSGHIAIKNIRFIKTLVVGDYQATFGQGLTLWQGFAFGKSASPMNVKRYGTGIKPYYSFDENRFFRGVAGTVKIKNFELTGLASYKKIDANVTLTDTTNNGEIDVIGISSLELSGLHNTNSLIQDKGIINQTVFGANLAYNKRNLHIGVTGQNMNLSAELIKTPTLYNKFDYQGKSNFVSGVDYNYVFKNVNLFGEFAVSASGGKALCQGLIVALDPKLTFSAHYRNFEKNFQNLYGNAISENTLPQNEKSIYLGMEAKLFKTLTFSVYMDQYQFTWIKSSASAPSTGRDIFTQLNYTPTKKIDMYFRFRHRSKFENSDEDNFYNYLVPFNQLNYRYNLSAQITSDIKFKSRIEYTRVIKNNQSNEDGVAFVQDLIYKKLKFPLTFTLRYAIFDTKSYDSRVYAYENDVLYSYSVPALYYKGQRAYFIVNWDITRNFEIWIRVASTIYDNQMIQSEGSLNQIDANHKTELKLQARLKF